MVYSYYMKLARLHAHATIEPYWHVQLTVLAAIGLQLVLNNKLVFGSKELIAGLEGILLVLLILFAPHKHLVLRHLRRGLAILLIAIISLANLSSLVLITNDLLSARQVTGKQLIISGLAIYLTNIIIFGLWYWELDNRASGVEDNEAQPVDFLFPQTAAKDKLPGVKDWVPTFLDYLYVSITNAAAFSPTDTMPLSHRAKSLMALQSLISLVTVALVAARAVNILG